MGNKIIMILADGMRPDFVMSSKNPYIKAFLSDSAYTMAAQTVMPSVTLPCHTSLFLSVPSERHGILTNTWVPQVRPVKGLVEVLSEAGKSCAFVYDWEPLRDLTRPESLSFAYHAGGHAIGFDNTLPRMIAHAREMLKTEGPDFMFVYMGLPDSKGHDYGFTTEQYAEAVSLVWDGIRSITEAAEAAATAEATAASAGTEAAVGEKTAPVEYGVIVLADHGGHERSHGENIPEDMTIPVILHGRMFQNADLSAGVSILDIAPTIAEAMGVKPDAEWEGNSLYR